MCVQFARSADVGDEQYAVKFFMSVAVYRREQALYRDDAIKHTLPELLLASDDATTAVRTEGGYPFPPFLVRNPHLWRRSAHYARDHPILPGLS